MNKDEVKILVDDVTGLKFKIGEVEVHIVELADELKECERQQIFLDFNVDVNAQDMLVSKLQDQDLMDQLMHQMACYHVEGTNTYFIFPGMTYESTEIENRFKCRILLLCPTEEEKIEEEFTVVSKE